MNEGQVQQIEDYVKQEMAHVVDVDLRIAHDFKHVDRVRRWALSIAEGEGNERLDLVEAAALLHDIGLAHISAGERHTHAQVGATLAARHLRGQRLLAPDDIDAITAAIRCHSSSDGGGRLGAILRDADKLDALGAVGLMRAFTSKYAKPEYPPDDVKGETWGMPMAGFEQRFADGRGIGSYIVDQINFQISFYGELHTATARRLGKPLVEFMRAYVVQLEHEVSGASAREA